MIKRQPMAHLHRARTTRFVVRSTSGTTGVGWADAPSRPGES
jgi:hypothetical protein